MSKSMICYCTFLDCNSHNGLWQYASWSCCTTEDPCELGAGDCDNDHECARDLTCGIDNCIGSIFPRSADCCENPTTTSTTTTTTTSPTTVPCKDIWPTKKCIKKFFQGKCKKLGTWLKCKKTCNKC